MPPRDGNRSCRIASRARSCPLPGGLRLLGRADDTVALIYAATVPGRSGALIPLSRFGSARCRSADGRGSEVSPGSFLQNELIQRQVRHGPAQPFILFLEPFEFLLLVRSHTAILLT